MAEEAKPPERADADPTPDNQLAAAVAAAFEVFEGLLDGDARAKMNATPRIKNTDFKKRPRMQEAAGSGPQSEDGKEVRIPAGGGGYLMFNTGGNDTLAVKGIDDTRVVKGIEALHSVTIQLMEQMLNYMVATKVTEANFEAMSDKKRMAKEINRECRRIGAVLKHPETGNSCTLLAVGDRYGGSFVLEDRKTKKRSHSTRDIKTLLPFRLIPLPDDA